MIKKMVVGIILTGLLLLLLLYLLTLDKETISPEKITKKTLPNSLPSASDKQEHQNTSKTTEQKPLKKTSPEDEASGSSEKELSELFIEDFGEDIIEEPIDAGYVFVNGQYLDAPYKVIRKGMGYFINDVMVYKINNTADWGWPPSKFLVKEDPGFPPGITRDSTFEEVFASEHSHRKFLYLYQNFPEGIAMQKIVEYYASLPCIRSVAFDGRYKGSIRVEMQNGEIIGVDIGHGEPGSWSHPTKPPTREDLLESFQSHYSYIRKKLLSGCCIVFFQYDSGLGKRYGDNIISSVGVYQGLPEMIEILKSDITLQEKKEKMKELEEEVYFNANLSPPTSDLSVQFKTTPQLEMRLNEIKEKRRTDPEFWLKRAKIASPKLSGEIKELLTKKSEELGRELTLEKQNKLCEEYFKQREEHRKQKPK